VHAVGNDVVTSGKVTFDDLLEVDPYRLKGHGVTLSQLENALSTSNRNVAGARPSDGEALEEPPPR
jgi:Cu/Ag efflux pump CusA